MKNDLICYICGKDLQPNERIAKVISIKETQQDNTNAHIVEYMDCQEEIYVHFNCLRGKKATIISYPAINIENFNQNDFSIIDKKDTNLEINKQGGTDSLIRSDILNF